MAAPEIHSSRWLARCRRAVFPYVGVQLIKASKRSGVFVVLADLRSIRAPLLWLHLDERDSADSTSISNRLSDALFDLYGARVFGHGTPVSHGVARLSRLHALLGPFVVVVSNAHINPEASATIGRLGALGSSVVLVVPDEAPAFEDEVFGATRTIDGSRFRMSLDEANEIAEGCLPTDAVEELWRRVDANFVDFVAEMRGRSGKPPLLEPEPSGFSISGSTLDEVPYELLVASLRRKGAEMDAFEVAARIQPDRCSELIEEAGPLFSVAGLHDRLYTILEGLPRDVLEESDSLMRWWFAAATSLGYHRDVRPVVERYLRTHEAPELRALYASAFPGPNLVEETRRAVMGLETPLTMRLHGFALGQVQGGDGALDFLMRALHMAEAFGDVDQVVAAATDICNYHIRRGGYLEAQEWAQWALYQHNAGGSRDELRKLVATSLLVFTRLLTDQTVGVEALVEEIDINEELHGRPTTEALVSTVGDWHFLQEHWEESAQRHRNNVEAMPWSQFPFFAPDLVQALLRLRQGDEATAVGNRARAMSATADTVSRAQGMLAAGMALMTQDTEAADAALSSALSLLEGNLEAHRLAQTAVCLAGLRCRLGDASGASDALKRGASGIDQLAFTGWRLVGGVLSDSELRALWRMYHRIDQELEIEFLGDATVRLHGESVWLTLRHAECLVILANEPTGLAGDRLATALYGDRAVPGTLKALISRLRSSIPLESRPYRLTVKYQADFLDLIEHLRRGRVRQALNLYRGPLLPKSEAPAVVELREHIDESLRQAVLGSGDAEAMIELANRTDASDLELLETALDHLSQNDPQSPLLRARIRQIRRQWNADAGGGRRSGHRDVE